ncbi:MAG: ArsR family transcriptional regulator [Haloferacaceae archaeon]
MDQFCEALANVYRRRVLVALLDGPDADVRVPEDVHAGERSTEALRAELYHTHLPHLSTAGLVRWDRETGVVRRGERFEAVEPLLAVLADHADELPGDLT